MDRRCVMTPSSLFMVSWPRLRIQMASLTLLLFKLLSLSRISVSSQPMTWFSVATWSVIADLLSSVIKVFLFALVYAMAPAFSASSLCSSTQTPSSLFVRQRMRMGKVNLLLPAQLFGKIWQPWQHFVIKISIFLIIFKISFILWIIVNYLNKYTCTDNCWYW